MTSPEKIPFMALERLHLPLREALIEATTRVIDSGVFVGGPEVAQLEQELAGFIGVKHAIGVSSGSDALLVSLMALGIGPGDEVITTPLSFFATIGAIMRLGATPVFADIEPTSFNLNPAHVRRLISTRTRAILPVHLFGQMAPMGELKALAQAHGLALVEDAAQAIGARCPEGAAGAIGELGCFSFFPTKNLGALGDGGLVTTDDDALAARVRALARHGATTKYYHPMLGGNFRLDPMQAALLRVKLPWLGAWNEQRAALAARYDEALSRLEPSLITPRRVEDHLHTFHQYCVRIPTHRDKLQAALTARNIGTMIYYPSPLHQQPCLETLGVQSPQECPEATRACQELLALPIHPALREDEQQRIIEALYEAFDSGVSS